MKVSIAILNLIEKKKIYNKKAWKKTVEEERRLLM